MHKARFDYHRPQTIEAAIGMLGGNAKVIAGGHSLLPVMKMRLAQPDSLIDLAGVQGLGGISVEDGALKIGAMCTHANVHTSEEVRRAAPVLAKTAGMIGDRQVRNRGTMGGSIAHADPAADYPTVLVALGATIHTRGPGGARAIAAADFFQDLFQTALAEDELITAVTVPVTESGASYHKHSHPASAYAVVGVAAKVAGDTTTLVVGGATGTPVAVTGPLGSDDDVMSSVAAAITDPMGDVYASGEYRVHLAGVLAKRALAEARG